MVLVFPRHKWLSPNVSNSSKIIQGTYFSSFQGVYYLYRGLRRAPKPYFCLILEFWIIFLIFYEWIILLNILDSIEWIFCWINILDFVLNWILNWIFRPNSMKKWIFKTYRQWLVPTYLLPVPKALKNIGQVILCSGWKETPAIFATPVFGICHTLCTMFAIPWYNCTVLVILCWCDCLGFIFHICHPR